jgi:hypothetical protein
MGDTQRALALVKCQSSFVTYMAANKEHEDSTDGASDAPERDLADLFEDVHAAFKLPEAPPPRDPQDVVKIVMDAMKRSEKETACRNMENLERICGEREAKLNSSRWAQTMHYIDQHPIKMTLGILGFLVTFLLLTLWLIDLRGPDPSTPMKEMRKQAAERVKKAQGGATGAPQPGPEGQKTGSKMSQEEMDSLKKMIDDIKLHQQQELSHADHGL